MGALLTSTVVRQERSRPGAGSAPHGTARLPAAPGGPGGTGLPLRASPCPQSLPVLSEPRPAHTRPAHLVLADVVGGDEDADADGDEDEADDEEGRKHRARRQDGLPSRQPLLFERGVVGLAGLHGAPAAAAHRTSARHPDAARGVPIRLLLGAVVHRHGAPTATATRDQGHRVCALGRGGCGRGKGGRAGGDAPRPRACADHGGMESRKRRGWNRPARSPCASIQPHCHCDP